MRDALSEGAVLTLSLVGQLHLDLVSDRMHAAHSLACLHCRVLLGTARHVAGKRHGYVMGGDADMGLVHPGVPSQLGTHPASPR